MWLINARNLLRYVWRSERPFGEGDSARLRKATIRFLEDEGKREGNGAARSIGKPILERFPNDTDKPYAILSHTWPQEGSKREEVSFQEMASGSPSAATLRKWGFAKIVRTCEEALVVLGHGFTWVDTCCIDKSSSSELSEAINSMFKWYERAAICLVFLEDLDPIPKEMLGGRGLQAYEFACLKACRWWSRGWTLQELISPRSVSFYDSSWTLRGDRHGWAAEIERICGVDRRVLVGETALADVPVAVRMSWAARRITSRKEDEAYSLLGIFDVNMPMLYGEGSKAFLRLQEEIIKENPDMSIFAWTDQKRGRRHCGILAESPSQFESVGRLVPSPNAALDDLEFSVTNRGLKFKTLLALDRVEGHMILPVNHDYPSAPTGPAYALGIYLRQVGRDLFVRAFPYQRTSLRRYEQLSVRSILIAKVLSPAQTDVISRRVMQIQSPPNLQHEDFRLVEVEPVGCWNPEAASLYAGHTVSFLGYLHFKPEWADQFESFILVCGYSSSPDLGACWRYDLVRGDVWTSIKPEFYDHYRTGGRADILGGVDQLKWPKSLVLPHLFDETRAKTVWLHGDRGVIANSRPRLTLSISDGLSHLPI